MNEEIQNLMQTYQRGLNGADVNVVNLEVQTTS